MPPKKMAKRSPEEETLYNIVAAELGVTVDYKTLKVFSENLSKLEERAIVIAKREAHDKAVQDGGDADEATMEGDTAAKRLTFKFKLTRSWNKARKHAPAAAAAAVVADPLDTVLLPAILPEKDAKRIEYLAAISAAYGRIMAHRVFKDILTALPNPIQTEDSGECGVQAAFDDEQCSTALTREKLYRSGCNFFWLNHLRSLMPGVPLSIDRTMEIVAKYWQSPKPFKGMVAVEARADGGLPRTHDLLILSPEEITHSYLLAIDGSIARGDSEDILLQWRKHCLSVCFEYHDLSGTGTNAAYWWSWNNREQVGATADAIKRTAFQRACEVYSYRSALEKQKLPCTAEAIANDYTEKAVDKKGINMPFIRECLTVFDKVCSVSEITAVIEKLEKQFGNDSCLNSLSKLQKIVEKRETVQQRILVFQGIDDAIERGVYNNSKFTREFLTGGTKDSGSSIPFVTLVIFRWRCRDHLLSLELPKEKLDSKDIQTIADKTSSYETYRRELDDACGADTSWIGAMNPSSVAALRLVQEWCIIVTGFMCVYVYIKFNCVNSSTKQDVVFGSGMSTALRQVILSRGSSPEDIMANALFQARWDDVVKTRCDEIIANKVSAPGSAVDLSEDNDMPVDEVEHATMRGGKSIDKCAHDTVEYWDSIAAQTVRQYIKLAPEAKSYSGIANDVKNSALNSCFVGATSKSTVAICLDPDLLQESTVRPTDRKPPPSQEIISKLLQGVLSAREGASSTEGLRVSPRDQDIMFLSDGGREVTKLALRVP